MRTMVTELVVARMLRYSCCACKREGGNGDVSAWERGRGVMAVLKLISAWRMGPAQAYDHQVVRAT
jgi:hypothetical protein